MRNIDLGFSWVVSSFHLCSFYFYRVATLPSTPFDWQSNETRSVLLIPLPNCRFHWRAQSDLVACYSPVTADILLPTTPSALKFFQPPCAQPPAEIIS